MKFNLIVFKRFFLQVKADSGIDFLLTLVFVIMISFASALLIRFTMDIIRYQNALQEFNADELNKLFWLNMQFQEGDSAYSSFEAYKEEKDSARDSDFKKYQKEELDQIDRCLLIDGFKDYPNLISWQTDRDSFTPNIHIKLFSKELKSIVESIASRKGFSAREITEKEFIFLDQTLAEKYEITDGSMIFIKEHEVGDKFIIPLQVVILNSPNIKCFMFNDYMETAGKHWLRFNFDDLGDALAFAWDVLYQRYNINKPIYIGYPTVMDSLSYYPFCAIANPDDVLGRMLSPNSLLKYTEGLSLSENQYARFEMAGEMNNLLDSLDVSQPLLINKKRIIDIARKGNLLSEDLRAISFHADIFSRDPAGIEKYFVLLDFYKGVDQMRDQVALFDLLQGEYDTEVTSYPKPKEPRDSNAYFYYDHFSDIRLSRSILEKFNWFNVVWDSGRWANIINLSESLNSARNKTRILMLITLIIIMLFLSVKFYLKLKLDFHTIGTIRSFGFTIREIIQIFSVGYIILITAGFALGFIVAFLLSVFSDYTARETSSYLAGFFTDPVNPVAGFYFLIIATTILIINIIIRTLVKQGNIYDLIKFES